MNATSCASKIRAPRRVCFVGILDSLSEDTDPQLLALSWGPAVSELTCAMGFDFQEDGDHTSGGSDAMSCSWLWHLVKRETWM